jgi:thymidylate synthase (FAD)
MRMLGEEAFLSYQDMLRDNVSRETARMVLPLSTYTQWCMTMNLHNLLHMLALRLDPHAQWETRQYAEMIADMVKDWVPLTWEAFEDYRLEGATFSKQELKALRILLRERGVTSIDLNVDGLSKREQDEFVAKLVR